MRKILILSICAVVFLAYPVLAVHKGAGGLDCSGCHIMHGSVNGTDVGTQDYLLRGSTQALCLSCHDSTGSSYSTYSGTAPVVMNATGSPASGDFANLDANDAAGTFNSGNGHNLGEGGNSVTPAGGSVIASGFTCTNCHDPHGAGATDSSTVSAYRNLKFTPVGGSTTISVIRALPLEGTLSGDVYPLADNSYGTAGTGISNVSAWCGSCHSNFFGDTNTGSSSAYTRHPTSNSTTLHQLGDVDFANYYTVAEGSRFPAEDTGSSAIANSGNSSNKSAGNEAADSVFCLSCHKPHASANADALRWSYVQAAQSSPGSACQQCHNK